MAFALFSLIIPISLSYLIMSAALNQSIPGPRWALILLKFILAAGLALGGTSCLFFLWLVVVGDPTATYGRFEQASLGVSALAWLAFLRSGQQTTDKSLPLSHRAYRGLYRVLLVVFCYLLSTRLVRFVLLSLNSPFGEVDATHIWTLRARVLFSGGDSWRELLSQVAVQTSCPDYPLLLPATIARLWTYWSEDSQVVPAAVACFFTFAIIGLGLAALTILRTRSQGLLAGIVLAGTAFLIAHGATQYADVPLAFYFMATFVFCCLYDKTEARRPSLLILAGLMAGLAAWTKNEGGLFALVVVLVRLVALTPLNGWRIALRQLLTFSAGLAPLALLLLFFKTQVAPATVLVVSQGVSVIWAKLANVSSYMEVGRAIASKILRVGHPGLTLFAVYWWLVGRAPARDGITLARTPAIVVFVMLLSYCFVFVITPFNSVAYQLATSLDRLWLHLWPSAVLFFFLWVQTPEEAMGQENLLAK